MTDAETIDYRDPRLWLREVRRAIGLPPDPTPEELAMYETEQEPGFAEWCILELMGHRRLGGFVSEVTLAGAGLLRVDVPGEGDAPAATQYYPPSALYCLTPTTEAMARAVARRNRPEPVARWELQPTLPVGIGIGSAEPDSGDLAYLQDEEDGLD